MERSKRHLNYSMAGFTNQKTDIKPKKQTSKLHLKLDMNADQRLSKVTVTLITLNIRFNRISTIIIHPNVCLCVCVSARFKLKGLEIVLAGVSFRSVGSGVHDGVI